MAGVGASMVGGVSVSLSRIEGMRHPERIRLQRRRRRFSIPESDRGDAACAPTTTVSWNLSVSVSLSRIEGMRHRCPVKDANHWHTFQYP